MVTTPATPPPWVAFGASVTGPAHAHGESNQDALYLQRRSADPGRLAIAVSDGHGDPRYFRSDRGAQLAVDVATHVADRFADRLEHLPATEDPAAIVSADLLLPITETWTRSVRSDLHSHPFEDAELDNAGIDQSTAYEEPLLAYGATLLLAVVTNTVALAGRLGDGDVVGLNGRAPAEQLFPHDPDLVANTTHSLCEPDAARYFLTRIIRLDDCGPNMFLLASDGYTNSFAEHDWYSTVASDLMSHLERDGHQWVAERLPEWLEESARATGDDVTVCAAYRAGLAPSS